MLIKIIVSLIIGLSVFFFIELKYGVFFGLLPFIAILSIIIHELGHIVFGTLTGHIIEEFSLFCGKKIYSKHLFNIEFCLRHPIFDENKNIVIGSAFIKIKDNFEISNLALNSGGVIFNLLVFIISMLFLNFLNMNYLSDCMTYLFKTTNISNVLSNIDSNLNSISASVISKSILMELALINSFLFFGNLIPVKNSDGYKIFGLNKKNGFFNKCILILFLVIFISFIKILFS